MSGRVEFIVFVGYPRETLAGHYLEGPRDAKHVKKYGYGFSPLREKAWPFRTFRAASAKARIVERHMSWGEGMLVVESSMSGDQEQPNADLATAPEESD